MNSENYKVVLWLLKDAIIENARGYDAKDERMGGNPNQMNIQSMYSDIGLDANGIELEFQASMEEPVRPPDNTAQIFKSNRAGVRVNAESALPRGLQMFLGFADEE